MHSHHGHDHGPGHHHHHAPKDFNRAFLIGVTLNVVYVIVEAGYGFATGSLALLGDAGHNLSDVLGLIMAWIASRLLLRPPTDRRTFGLRRSTILAALGNAVILLIAIGAIAWEAIQRLLNPQPVPGTVIMIVAGIGIVINGATAALFHSGRKEDLNIRGAFLHMLYDAVISAGVVLTGLLILFTGWYWVDPLVSVVIVVLIAIGTWDLFKQSLNLALDAVPAGVDPDAVLKYLEELPGVLAVEDLHIWGLSTTDTALTVHLVAPEVDSDELITSIHNDMQYKFAIGHCTIEVARSHIKRPCSLTHPWECDHEH
jgi:cobalt-zinc-cadmium efflux system protein